ncbi:PREDICTED: endoplasmic reticulum-Golgi intermediate compartment protein 1 isoform X1 [Colobus angolensis palliatus]|uniref:endoplasmic reticulum-Golgi intermediate compartment protein 1 isoform X1 n=1 Tax=Colobus angolensis palliatus TaxID=336983 RepID=UPI0005F469FA|nr:PREDICTED: endoplasmic reticulum-Golgi intermediate compartment protein 1 isoform X1 [Colobus angolensis palliatus]
MPSCAQQSPGPPGEGIERGSGGVWLCGTEREGSPFWRVTGGPTHPGTQFVLLILISSTPGIRRLQPHRPHHPCHLVPLRPQPHHGQVHRETAAAVQIHHYDLCHHWRDLHRRRHSGLMHLHSLRGLEEDPTGQDALTPNPASQPRTLGIASLASNALSPLALNLASNLAVSQSVCGRWGERRGWLHVSQLPLFPVFYFRQITLPEVAVPLSLGSPKSRVRQGVASPGILGTPPRRAAVFSLLGEYPRMHIDQLSARLRQSRGPCCVVTLMIWFLPWAANPPQRHQTWAVSFGTMLLKGTPLYTRHLP